MDMKFLAVTAALLALLLGAWILFPMLGSPQAIRDPYSVNCSAGMYATEAAGCAPLVDCDSDIECKYLEKSTLPPRYGKCESGRCKAYCGSGRTMECVN